MARPSKLTDECQARLVEALRSGATYALACQAAGVDYSTFRRWMRRGEKAKSGRYRLFHEAIRRAEGECAMSCLEAIRDSAPKEWTAAAWLLERRHGYTKDMAARLAQEAQHEAEEPERDMPNLATKEGRRVAVESLAELPPSMLREALVLTEQKRLDLVH